MGKDPSMPFYVNDWLSSAKITRMTLEQQGAYLRLLCYCWASQDASLPGDDESLATLSGMGKRWSKGGSQLVRECLIEHPDKPGFLTQERAYHLWQERMAWRDKSVAGGKRSGASRRSKGGSSGDEPNGQPEGNSPSPSPSSSPSPPPPTPSAGEPDAEWEAVAVELIRAGVTRARNACEAARNAGCTTADVRALLAHFDARKPAWAPGALCERIKVLLPGQDPTTLWPPPSPAAVAAETSEARAAHAGKAEYERRDAAEKLRVEADRLERLERDHGPTVDALDRDAIRALAVQCLGSGGEFATKRIPTLPLPAGVVRLALLDHFDSQTARAP